MALPRVTTHRQLVRLAPWPQTNDQESQFTQRLFNSGGNGAIVSLATTPQRRHDDVTSLEGVRCSAGEFPVCRAPHSLAICHDNFTAQRLLECCATTIQTKHQRSCTPAPASMPLEFYSRRARSLSECFYVLFYISNLLLHASSPNHFCFTPDSQL